MLRFMIALYFLLTFANAGTMSSGGIAEKTFALSCEVRSGNEQYRLKLSYSEQPETQATSVRLYKSANGTWNDLSASVVDVKPVQTFKRFAGVTSPNTEFSENSKIMLGYFWNGPTDRPLRTFSLTFDAKERSLRGNYQANLVFILNATERIAGQATCYADVIVEEDPFAN